MVLGALVGVLALSGCADDRDDSLRAAAAATTVAAAPSSGTATGSVAPNGTVESILAIDNNFVPQTLTVAAGTEVRWDNNGRNGHNVIPADDPSATSWGVPVDRFQPGASYSHVFDTPGTYVYYCSIHGTANAGMFGTIIVTAP